MEPWEHPISKQPLWVQELLDEVHFPDGFLNPFAIVDCFNKEGHLITVSDGSVIFHDMIFGWVLASPDGTSLAQGAGPCAGRSNSLQSEGADMLTVTFVMSLVLTFTDGTNLSLPCILIIRSLSTEWKSTKSTIFHSPTKEPNLNSTLPNKYFVPLKLIIFPLTITGSEATKIETKNITNSIHLLG